MKYQVGLFNTRLIDQKLYVIYIHPETKVYMILCTFEITVHVLTFQNSVLMSKKRDLSCRRCFLVRFVCDP